MNHRLLGPMATALLLLWCGGLAAQEARFDHNRAIERLVGRLGGAARLATAPPSPELRQLAAHLQDRAEFHLDLYEFQRTLGSDYAAFRDTVGNALGSRVGEAVFYAARHLDESGDREGALRQYRRAQGIPATQPDAARWSGSAGAAQGWEQTYLDWRRDVWGRAPACGPAPDNPSCRILAALLADDLGALFQVSSEVVQGATQADRTVTLNRDGAALRIEFFEPSLPLLLAAADFRLAAAAMTSLGPDASVLRAGALLGAGRLAEAETILRGLSRQEGDRGMLAKVWLGEAMFRRGDRAGADEEWRGVLRRGAPWTPYLLASWTRLKDGGKSGAVRAFTPASAPLGEALLYARAAIREGMPDVALGLLDRHYDPRHGTDPQNVRPRLLVLMAHARYLLGREQWGLARELFVPLQSSFPVVRGSVVMLQELTATSRTSSTNVRVIR